MVEYAVKIAIILNHIHCGYSASSLNLVKFFPFIFSEVFSDEDMLAERISCSICNAN